MLPLKKVHYHGDVNIGHYGVITDRYALVPDDFSWELEVKKIPFTVSGTYLIGLFCAGNSNGIIVPDMITGREIKTLEEARIPYLVVPSKHNCIGNLLCVNDKGGILGKQLVRWKEKIEKFLKVKLVEMDLVDLGIVGSVCVCTNRGFLAHRDVEERDIENIEKALGVRGSVGSVNFGSPYVRSGILANSSHVLAGSQTSGHEIIRIQETLCSEDEENEI